MKTSLAELGLTQSRVLFDAAQAVGVLFVLFVALFLAVSKVADVNQVAATVGIILLGLTKSSLKQHVDTDKMQSFKSIIKVVEKQALTQLKDAVEQFAESAAKDLDLNEPVKGAQTFRQEVLENTEQTLEAECVLNNYFSSGIVRDAHDWHKERSKVATDADENEYSLRKVESSPELRDRLIQEYISYLEANIPSARFLDKKATQEKKMRTEAVFFARSKYGQFKDEVTRKKTAADELIMKREKHYAAVLKETKRKIEDMVTKVKQKAQELEDSTRSVLQSSRAVASSVENHTTRKADEMRDDLKEMKQKLSEDLQMMKDEMKAMILASSRAASNPDADETEDEAS